MDRKVLYDLKNLAQKANPGPWTFVPGHPHQLMTVKENWPLADVESFNDAAFMAAANPAIVLALIEKIERLEEDFEAAARSAADESVKAVKLEEEADWLAQQASLMCDCIENCDQCRLFSECGCNGQNSKEIWRNAAREAAAKKAAEDAAHNPE